MNSQSSIIYIMVFSILINNVVLSQFLGICPFLGVSNKVETAAGMGGAVIFVITIASAIAAVIYQFILEPFGLSYLNTIVFILVIAALVQLVEMFLKKSIPSLYKALGVYLPLITTNCAVLGVVLLNVQNGFNILQSIVNGFATACGFAISLIIMAGLREKMEYNDIAKPVKGMPFTMFTASLMAIAFCGFAVLK
ncbi:MAG: RnfABCDGE type electron transport complex subunit A [Lachnospiraceae bacterium]|nr:RnfABCDGE type electron transport complex subunit A [Lachnospiraceae bacterium]